MSLYEPISIGLQSAQLHRQAETNNRLASIQAHQTEQANRAANLKSWRDYTFTTHEQIPSMAREVEHGNASLGCWWAMTALNQFRLFGITAEYFDAYEDKHYFSETEAIANQGAERIGPEMASALSRLFLAQQSICIYRRIIGWYEGRSILDDESISSKVLWWIGLTSPFLCFVFVPFFREIIMFGLLFVVGVYWVEFQILKGINTSKLRAISDIMQPLGIRVSEEATVRGIDEAISHLKEALRSLGQTVPTDINDAKRILNEKLEFISSESGRQQLVLPAV